MQIQYHHNNVGITPMGEMKSRCQHDNRMLTSTNQSSINVQRSLSATCCYLVIVTVISYPLHNVVVLCGDHCALIKCACEAKGYIQLIIYN